MSPFPVETLIQKALALHRSGAIAEAAALYGEALQIEPDNADAPYYLGLIACQTGRFEEGADHARQCLRVVPGRAAAHVLLGRALCALHQPEQALPSFERAVALAPALAQAHSNYADCLSDLGRNAEAVESYDRSLALAPDLATDWYNRGLALAADERHGEAVTSFDRAIAADQSLAAARLERAKALSDLRRYDDALREIEDLLTADPKLAAAWLGRGNILAALNCNAEALATYDKALALSSDLAEAWSGRGHVLCNLKQYDEALSAHDRALRFNPALSAAWIGRGDVFVTRGRWTEAAAAYAKAAALKPRSGYAACLRLHAKLQVCDWKDLTAEAEQLVATACAGVSMPPFAMLALPTTAADQLQFARQYVKSQQAFPAIWRGEVYRHDRIRVAYLSGDFRDHPVAHLTVGLFEHHDRSRFEVTGLSFETDPKSAMQRRIENAFEHFIPAADKTDSEIAEHLRASEIDIVVDLMGFTMNNRAAIFARRPVPIQLNYLGYPGTMGAGYIDYILADLTIIPEEQRAFYSENVVWLPDSYQVNDRRRLVSERPSSRQGCGLPEQVFVFCAFNNSYKITPQIFDVWMRILKETDGAVLWLRGYEPIASANLRREAEIRGVAAERLVFAAHIGNHTEHLARYRCADLFLDTLPYNAHTTASDALWAGVPVLTCLGTTFAGRVAASVLKSVGLDELIARSLEEYEALALKLARDRAYLAFIKNKLAHNRDLFPLFDAARATRQIESAYEMMWRRYQSKQQDGSDTRPILVG